MLSSAEPQSQELERGLSSQPLLIVHSTVTFIMSRSSFVTLRGWFTLAVLCLVFRSPSCDCPTPRRDSLARRHVVKRVPSPLPALRPNALAALPKANIGKEKSVQVRNRFHQRPYSAVSRIRCQIQYAMSRGLPYEQVIPECSSRLELLAGGGHPSSWIFGSHLLPPLPPTGTTQLPPTTTTDATIPRSPTTAHSWRKGTVLVDRNIGHGSRLWLRDEVLEYLADSRVSRFVYRLRDGAKSVLGAATVWLSKSGDLSWDFAILGLLVLGSALVARSSGSDDANPASVDVATLVIAPVQVPISTRILVSLVPRRAPLMIEWCPAERQGKDLAVNNTCVPSLVLNRRIRHCSSAYSGLLTLVPADVLASLLFKDLRSALNQCIPSRPRLMIEWRPAACPDLSSEAPETPPAARPRPRPTVRPGHSVYYPPALQAELTEERRIERSEAQRQVLEQVEREAQESTAGAVSVEDAEQLEGQPHKRKTRRAGRKVKERREKWARAREQALAEMEEGEEA